MTQADGSRTSEVGRTGLVAASLIAAGAMMLLGAGTHTPRAQAGAPPPNDDLLGGYQVNVPISPLGTDDVDYTNTQSTAGATFEQGETPCLAEAGASVWYQYYPVFNSRITIDTAGSDYATVVGAYLVTGVSPPGGSVQELACAGTAREQAAISIDTRAGAFYVFQIMGVGGATGTLRIRVACDPACPPANDQIAAARYPERFPYEDAILTHQATLEQLEPQPCANIGKTSWYRFDSFDSIGDTITVRVYAGGFAPVVAVYNMEPFTLPSPPGGLHGLSCEAATPTTTNLVASWATESGRQYFIQVGGADQAGGSLSIEITCAGATCGRLFPFLPDTPAGDALAPDTQDVIGGQSRGVRPPDTGSGGYR